MRLHCEPKDVDMAMDMDRKEKGLMNDSCIAGVQSQKWIIMPVGNWDSTPIISQYGRGACCDAMSVRRDVGVIIYYSIHHHRIIVHQSINVESVDWPPVQNDTLYTWSSSCSNNIIIVWTVRPEWFTRMTRPDCMVCWVSRVAEWL